MNTLRLAFAALLLSLGAAASTFKTTHPAELSRALKSKSAPVVYDANGQSTREHAGLIPGARLLASFDKYDPKAELPADPKTPLVFYCANTMCTSSHVAAERALAAGHADVSVMVDGIYGWKKAGLPVEAYSAAPRKLGPREVSGLVREGKAVVVDVREDEERHEVVPGALWLPMSKAKDESAWRAFVATLPKDKTVVFHCAAGLRAKRAAGKLAQDGLRSAYFEGPDQWKSQGLPLEKGPAR